MELKDIIYKRQSVREYTDAEIPKEDILKIIDAGRVAPSGKNCQNWHFVIVRDSALRDKIGQAILDKNEEIALRIDKKDTERGLRFRKFVRRFTLFGMKAPVLIAVYATEYKPDGWAELTFAEYPQDVIDKLYIRNPGMQSIGAAVENMTLTAIDLGYGSCWMSGHSYASEDIEAVIKKETGFEKENYFIACLLAIGVPEGERKSPAKKEIEEICTFV